MKVGVLGLGSIGLRHASNLKKLDYEFFGYDIDKKKSKKIDALGGIFFSNKQELIDIIDVGIIATPNHCHLDDLKLLTKNKKHCFIEKPISHEIKETSRLIDISKKNKKIICVGQNLRFNPAVKRGKQWLIERKIGKIIWSELICSSYLPDWRKNQNYLNRYTNNKDTGGVIFDSIHELDLANYLIGKGNIINCYAKNSGILKLQCEDIADIFMKHENGSSSLIHLDYLTRPKIRFTRIVGDKGIILINISKRFVKLIGRNGKIKKSIYFNKNLNNDYLNELKSFFESIKKKKKPFCSGNESIDILKQALQARKFAFAN